MSAPEMIWAGVVPALAAAVILVLGWRPWRTDGEAPHSTWSDALAFGLAYAATWALVAHSAPTRIDYWLAWFVAIACGVGALQGRLVLPAVLRWGGRFVLSLFLLVTALAPLSGRWPRPMLVLWYVGLLVGMPALWALLEALARRSGGASLPVSFASVATAAAVALDHRGAVGLSLACAALAAALVAWATIAGLRRRMSLARGALPVLIVLGFGAPLLGRLHAGLPSGTLGLLALGLLAPWAAELPWMRRRSSWERAVVRVGAAAIPAAGAIVVST